jgi:hypothetical protein
LKKKRDVVLEDVEASLHHDPASKHFRQTPLNFRVGDVDFQKRTIADVIAVERDSFAGNDESNGLRRPFVVVVGALLLRESEGVVERNSEAVDVRVDC